MGKEVIKVFTAGHCDPCHEVFEMIKRGFFESDVGEVDVDLIDLETEEGFSHVNEVDRVPSASYQGKPCKISIDRELGIVLLSCVLEGSPALSAPGTDTPAPNP